LGLLEGDGGLFVSESGFPVLAFLLEEEVVVGILHELFEVEEVFDGVAIGRGDEEVADYST
jgi:hypothetical protein